MPSGVSVVIPSYRGADAVAVTLTSLAVQTLTPDRFEIVLVVNGPTAADLDLFEVLRERWTDLDVRIVSTTTASASLAWNLGIQAARMEWLTFLDDDDTVTPTYLEALLDVAEPGLVALAEIHDLRPDGSHDAHSRLNTLIAGAAGARRTAGQLPQALGFNAAKLVATRWARAVTFDLELNNGQDVVYWCRIAMDHDVVFSVVPTGRGAAYLRGLSDTSMSRQEAGFSFSVQQRLDVIECLERARRSGPRHRRYTADHLIAAQTHLIHRYLVAYPERREAIAAAVAARHLGNFPYPLLNRDLAATLVVVADGERPRRRTVRQLAALLERGEPVDMIAVSVCRPRWSWIDDFWRETPLKSLQGRVLRLDSTPHLAARLEQTVRWGRYADIRCCGGPRQLRKLVGTIRPDLDLLCA